MEKVYKSFLVNHSSMEMFNLVNDVLNYPNFLPWCNKSEVLNVKKNYLEARLSIDYFKIKKTFATKNYNQPGKAIHMKLLEGPFKFLEGYWRFDQISKTICKVSLNIEYEFSNLLLKTLMGRLFNYITINLLESFVKEADARYKKK